MNVLSLWVDALEQHYSSGYWASYRQWQEIGGQVRGGERGSLILFYKPLDKQNEENDEEKQQRFVVRTSTVFNVAQVDG